MASSSPLKIGILNIMHDKVDTKKRFDYVLTRAQMSVELKYFYPKDHYQDRPKRNGGSARIGGIC